MSPRLSRLADGKLFAHVPCSCPTSPVSACLLAGWFRPASAHESPWPALKPGVHPWREAVSPSWVFLCTA